MFIAVYTFFDWIRYSMILWKEVLNVCCGHKYKSSLINLPICKLFSLRILHKKELLRLTRFYTCFMNQEH